MLPSAVSLYLIGLCAGFMIKAVRRKATEIDIENAICTAMWAIIVQVMFDSGFPAIGWIMTIPIFLTSVYSAAYKLKYKTEK